MSRSLSIFCHDAIPSREASEEIQRHVSSWPSHAGVSCRQDPCVPHTEPRICCFLSGAIGCVLRIVENDANLSSPFVILYDLPEPYELLYSGWHVQLHSSCSFPQMGHCCSPSRIPLRRIAFCLYKKDLTFFSHVFSGNIVLKKRFVKKIELVIRVELQGSYLEKP